MAAKKKSSKKSDAKKPDKKSGKKSDQKVDKKSEKKKGSGKADKAAKVTKPAPTSWSQALRADGHGNDDHSALACYYEKLAKVEISR